MTKKSSGGHSKRGGNMRIALLAVIAGLVFMPAFVVAQTIDESGTLGFEGVVPGDPPDNAPTITSPQDGDTFTDIPVNVRGSCDSGLLIKIFKNDVFAGSGICGDDGIFEIPIDLFNGTNILRANQFDALDQQSPDSNLVEVTYQDPGLSGQFTQVEELILSVNFARKGTEPFRPIEWTIGITGGLPPYAIDINWGDGTSDLYSVDSSGNFTAQHTYDNPGTYIVVVRGSDSTGLKSFLQFITVVNGDPGAGTFENDGLSARVIERYILWPVIVLGVLAVLNFYVGRRYQIRREQQIRQRLASSMKPTQKAK